MLHRNADEVALFPFLETTGLGLKFPETKLFEEKISCVFVFCFETGFWYVAQGGLKLSILLPQPPECWNYRCELSHLACKGNI
jgi:hypothetical protein